VLIVKVEGPHGTCGDTGRFHVVEQRNSVVAHVAFAGDPFLKIKPRDLEGAGLKAVSTPDAFALIDDHRSLGQLGNGLDRTDPSTSRPCTVMAGPVLIGFPGSVLAVDTQIDHYPVVSCEVYLPVCDQFIPFNSQTIPPLACRHATLAADASHRINKFPISFCLRTSNADRS